jgi:hypothetical protein
MKRPAGAVLLLVFLGSAAISSNFGQTSGHQRISVETESRHRLEAAADCYWRASGANWSVDFDASLEYAWKKKLSFCISMPFSGEGAESESTEKTAEPASWSVGDPSVSASYLWRGDRRRIQAGISYAYPLESKRTRGFHAITPSLSLSVVRDPVILTIGLDARFCLPRESEGYLLWPPFSGGLSLSAWELLNDRISYRISMSPGVSLGTLRLGVGDAIVPRWSLGLAISLSWDEKNWGFQAGCGESSHSDQGSAQTALNLGGSYRKEW